MVKHIWKDIKGWEGYYSVNEFGDVLNIKTGRLLTGDKNSTGYPRVKLYRTVDGVQTAERFFRHRLVAENFVENDDPINKREVNHINLDITDNCYKNLEWCNKKYNEIHSRRNGSKEYKQFEVVFENGDKYFFNSKQELADMLGLTRGAIKHWLKGITKGYRNYGIKEISYV